MDNMSSADTARGAIQPASADALPASAGNSLKVVVGAAAQLHHALGDPVPQSALGFVAQFWAIVVSMAKTIWRSVVTAWQPANYFALAFFFIAGVFLSDFAMQYVRLFSAIIVVLVGVLFIMVLMKRNERQS